MDLPFEFKRIEALPDLILVEARQFADERGWFMETYKKTPFADAGIEATFVQDNHSLSRRKGTLRGLHYQNPPKAQGKLVRCIRGRIFDVAVDIREGSPHYADWFGIELGADGGCQLWVPPGFAHGFCTLEPDTEVQYKVTAEYDPELDSGFAWDDPEIGIDWPIESPVLNNQDREVPVLSDSDADFEYEGEA